MGESVGSQRRFAANPMDGIQYDEEREQKCLQFRPVNARRRSKRRS